jgi:hypothetical protein
MEYAVIEAVSFKVIIFGVLAIVTMLIIQITNKE